MSKKQDAEVQIVKIGQESVTVCVLGTAPIILNRLSEKAKHELLMPRGRKNAAEKASSLKHQPMEEFAAAAHRVPGGDTLLAIPSTAFKGAMRTAALDIPGATKAAIGRLCYVPGEYVGLYGVPTLKMDIVRSADIKRTPDVRTRVCLPEWAAVITVQYVSPLIKQPSVVNLLAAAGITAGVGDFRVEKGAGSFGTFTLVDRDDAKFKQVVETGGRAVQEAAMATPEPYDDETHDLLSWFGVEANRRGFKVAS